MLRLFMRHRNTLCASILSTTYGMSRVLGQTIDHAFLTLDGGQVIIDTVPQNSRVQFL